MLQSDDEALIICRELRLNQVMRTHQVEHAAKPFAHLTHIAKFAKGSCDDRVSRLMNALKRLDPFDRHCRQQRSRTPHLEAVIEHVHLDRAAFDRVIAVCDSVCECLAAGVLGIPNLLFEPAVWTEPGLAEIRSDLLPRFGEEVEDAPDNVSIVDNVVFAPSLQLGPRHTKDANLAARMPVTNVLCQ